MTFLKTKKYKDNPEGLVNKIHIHILVITKYIN